MEPTTPDQTAERHRSSFLRVGLVICLGALVVATIVALVLPPDATNATGFSGTLIVRSRVPDAMTLSADGASDVQVAKLTFAPDASGGWHSHRGYVLVTVAQGIATFYDKNDPGCTPHRYHAGEGLLESPRHPHITRNEGAEPLVLYVVSISPEGRDSDIDEPASAACHW